MYKGADRFHRPFSRIAAPAVANANLYLACFVFLFISLVGLGFLSPPSGELGVVMRREYSIVPGPQNTLRQFMFVGAFLVLTFIYLNRWGIASLVTIIPSHVYLLFGWAAITLLWSPVPELGGRRLAIMAIIVACSFTMARIFGAERTIRFVFSFLLIFVFLSVIAGFLLPTMAIHQFDEEGIGLIGDWRGLFQHKNDAGFVAAACCIELIFSQRPYVLKGAGLSACGFLLWMSKAKTSLILLPVSLLLYIVLILAPRQLGIIARLIALLLLSIIALLSLGEIEAILSDPDALSGRIVLWSAIIQFLESHFWTGGGFGSVWDVGTVSPLLRYLGGWTETAAHAHNGYLNVMAEIGFPGLVLTVFSFFIWPLFKLKKQSILSIRTRDLIFCLLLFISAHNLLETDIMIYAAPSVLLILCCAVAGSLPTESSMQEAAYRRRSRTVLRQQSRPVRF